MQPSPWQTICFTNLTDDEQFKIFKREHAPKVDIVYKVYFGWLQLPLAIIALTLTVFYIMAVYRAIKSRRVSRKCYVLLLNRAIGDLLCCVSALITVAYVLLVKNIRREIIGVIDSFFIGCFWSATVSYVALSLLKFFAVWKPFDYRQAITMRRCVKLCMMSWVIFALMVCYTLSATALVKIPVLQKWSGCRIETCLVIMYRSRNMLTAIVYVFTIVVFAFTVMFVQRAHKFARSFRTKNGDSANETRFRFPLWKLSLNVGTFAVLNLFYVIWAMFMLVQDQCFFQHYYAEMMRLLGLIRSTLILRIPLDAIISFLTDSQIRRGVLGCFGLHRQPTIQSGETILPGSSSAESGLPVSFVDSLSQRTVSVKGSLKFPSESPNNQRTHSVRTVA